MRVGFISKHCCARTMKESFCLQQAGIEGIWMHEFVANPKTEQLIGAQIKYTDEKDFPLVLERLGPVDLFHIHDQPDWMITIVKNRFPEIPVLADVHDFKAVIMDEGNIPDYEARAFMLADAYLFPSVGYADYALNLYRQTHKIHEVVYSMCPERFANVKQMARVRGIVYEGLVSVADPDNPMRQFAYSDYREIFTRITALGIPVFAFGGDNSWMPAYSEAGSFNMACHEYFQMMNQLTRFDWGFVGGAGASTQWKWAMPNKLFEYITAGIPVICLAEAGEAAAFVRQHDVGVVIDKIEDIAKIYDKADEYRAKAVAKRGQFCMENEVNKILAVYDKLLNREQSGEERQPLYTLQPQAPDLPILYPLHGHGKFSIGPDAQIKPDSFIDVSGNVTMGSKVHINRGTTIYTHDHTMYRDEPILDQNNRDGVVISDLIVGDDVWFGDGCLVIGSVTNIPTGTVIAARAVLTKNPEGEYGIYAGVPAKFIGVRKSRPKPLIEKVAEETVQDIGGNGGMKIYSEGEMPPLPTELDEGPRSWKKRAEMLRDDEVPIA